MCMCYVMHVACVPYGVVFIIPAKYWKAGPTEEKEHLWGMKGWKMFLITNRPVSVPLFLLQALNKAVWWFNEPGEVNTTHGGKENPFLY